MYFMKLYETIVMLFLTLGRLIIRNRICKAHESDLIKNINK